jgi:NADP-dependent 3-hydroxy acid dehydrogenase YdfG
MSGIGDKVVVITGANSGIGEATAVMLAEHGAKVVLSARRLDRLDALARRITGAGGIAKRIYGWQVHENLRHLQL